MNLSGDPLIDRPFGCFGYGKIHLCDWLALFGSHSSSAF